ncbi:MAG TPA: hypothetical protein VM925_00820 [Labilithrix sp.]|nr:hypothetical protein [Labilithrix sp.]
MAALSFAVACESLLGDFEVVPDTAFGIDAGGSDTAQPPQQQQVSDGSVDGSSVVRACELETDCKAPMEPAGCAVAECIEHKCVYKAIDKDGDGHPFAGCKADGVLLPGDDCADEAPTIFPGGSCTKRPDGTDIVFPNGTPLGACKAGTWDCARGKPACLGAIEPQPTENCTLKNDANCDGTLDEGCDCTPNTAGPCGNAGNLPLPCTKGTRTCSPQGKWGACVGNIEPKARDCSSTVDNNCNGAGDLGEAACKCPGDVAQGGKAPCSVPNTNGKCADGFRTCQPSPDKQSGVFGPCAGPLPAAKDCKSAEDFDCNGLSDELEVACGSPCLDPNGFGNTVTAAQKFHGSMWGCGATRNWGVRSVGCEKGWRACSVEEWTKYIRSAAPKPPTHKYWFAEQLGWGGAPPECYVPFQPSAACGPQSSMTVCPYAAGGATVTDAEGNVCNWSGCTYGNEYKFNDYLGGCAGNDTGGTLCCPQ